MSIAKGQDEQAEDLLQNIPTSVCLVIPSICYVESLTTLGSEEKCNQDFLSKLDIQINEAELPFYLTPEKMGEPGVLK